MTAALFFGVAALIAIAVVVGKKAKVALSEREFASLRGRDPSSPISVTSYAEVDAVVDGTKCACSGPMIKIGEGPASPMALPVSAATGPLHRVLTECRYCGRKAPLYFDATGVPQ